MDRTQECPLCAKEIKADARDCPFCGSDLSASHCSTEGAGEANAKRSSRLWNVLEFILVGAVFLAVYYLLPEEARQWVDWYCGKDKWYSPNQVLWLALLLVYLALSRLFRWRTSWTMKRAGKEDIQHVGHRDQRDKSH